MDAKKEMYEVPEVEIVEIENNAVMATSCPTDICTSDGCLVPHVY